MKELYTNDKELIVVDPENRFIYDVSVFVLFDNIYSIVNSKSFYCYNEIKGIIKSYFINKYTEVYTSLYAAPKEWLISNGYFLYVEVEKKKRIKKEKNEENMSNKRKSRRVVSETTYSRIKKL